MNTSPAGTTSHAIADATSPPRLNATPTVPTIDAATVSKWLRDGSCTLIDVREPDEHARERIAEATLEPLSGMDARTLAARAGQGRHLVIHCKSGRRSADAVAQVLAHVSAGTSVHSLAGGIEAWRAEGLPTKVDQRVSRLSVMRQVQLTVGIGVMAGCALAWLVHPAFLILPAFLGAGLTVAGASGTCGLALMLEHMPWNRIPAR